MRSIVGLALILSTPAIAQPAPALERITFAKAVQRALEHNPQMLSAEQEVRRAEAQVEQARAPSLPTLSGNATYTRLDADRKLGEQVLAGQNQLNANATVTVPLLAPTRWATWSRAADAAATVKANREEVRRQVASTVARAYLSVVGQRRVVEANQRALATSQTHLSFIQERLKGGLGTRLDEVRAAQEVNATLSQLELANASLTRARENLGVLVGADAPLEAEDGESLEAPPPLDSALKEVQEKRTDVRANEERLLAAQRSTRLGWTDYLPLLSAVFQPFYQNPPSLTTPQTGWQAQAIFSLPLYDGGLRYGQQHERQALEAQARVGVEGILRQARAEVRAAFEGVQHNDAALRAAQDSAKLAAQALQLSNLAYQAGATTNLEVVDAERRARDAETAAAQAEDAVRQARLDLLVASGRFP